MFMTVKQASEKWGISDRRIRVLCSEGKIPGAYQEGRGWKIPVDYSNPQGGFDNRISRPPRLPRGEFELPLTNYLGAINKEKGFPKTEQKFRKGIDKLS